MWILKGHDQFADIFILFILFFYLFHFHCKKKNLAKIT